MMASCFHVLALCQSRIIAALAAVAPAAVDGCVSQDKAAVSCSLVVLLCVACISFPTIRLLCLLLLLLQMMGVPEEEAVRLIAAGQRSELLDRVYASFTAYREMHDMVIVHGTAVGELGNQCKHNTGH
jgi:hypothetical protein